MEKISCQKMYWLSQPFYDKAESMIEMRNVGVVENWILSQPKFHRLEKS